jgi:two-component system CheB/CheR fusion protein
MVELEKNDPASSAEAPAEAVQPEILAVLAHELRNPLAPIRNGVELLRSICSDPKQAEVVDMVSRQVVHLTRLLNDLLDASRLRQGLVTLQKRTVDFSEIVRDALDAVQPAIDARRQSLLVSLPATPVQMYCDPTRLTQVLQNLLSNANRFTGEGGSIWIKTEVADGNLSLEVADDGDGIDPSLLPRLFNVFAQGEQALHRPQGGLGMGLVIARNVVEMHGGTIRAHSLGRGRGSQFIVDIPIEPQPSADLIDAAANANQLGQWRVLVVDDNPLVAISLTDCLKELGYDVVTANSGEAAIALIDEFHPHAAVLDVGLPGMDGFELAKQLRGRFASVVLVAVSGYSWDMLREADATVFAKYLVKPVSPERIVVAIEAELGRLDVQLP